MSKTEGTRWIPRGTLEIIIGPMFSGKTTELIRRIRRYEVLGRRVLVVNSSLDTRCGNEIRSHDAKVQRAQKVGCLADLGEDLVGGADVVAIDEAQFFGDLVETVRFLRVECGLDVLVAGLSGDAEQQKFGDIPELVPVADSITHLQGLCTVCCDGTPGSFSVRLSRGGEQTDVGAADKYACVCGRHLV